MNYGIYIKLGTWLIMNAKDIDSDVLPLYCNTNTIIDGNTSGGMVKQYWEWLSLLELCYVPQAGNLSNIGH